MDHHGPFHRAQDQSSGDWLPQSLNYHGATQYDPQSRVVYQTSSLGLTSDHLEYHGYNRTPSSNIAGFIFDIEPGYEVSVRKLRS